MRQNFVAQFVQLLKHWLYNMLSSLVVEKNWALSVDQSRLQALQFLVHLVNLMSILLRYNGFARIQKAAVDPTAADHQTDHNLFFGVSLTLESALELLFTLSCSLLVVV